LEIYDGALSEPRIGVKSSYSDTLLKNILASIVSDRIGSKSVDYVRKRYLDDWKRDVSLDPNAFDINTIHFLDVSLARLQEHLIANSYNLIYSEVQKICDMTLAKGLGTLRVALDLGSKGLLHEVLTLCRSSLEMIMWAFTIFDCRMRKIPLNFCPKKESLGSNPISRTLASIMAILSGFSHWRKETHTRVFDFEEENIAILYASGRNKWEAIANVMLMTRLYAEGYTAKYISLKCKPGCKHFLTEIHEVSKKIGKKQQEWLKFFIELEGQHLTASFLDIFSVS